MVREVERKAMSGIGPLLLQIAVAAACVVGLIFAKGNPWVVVSLVLVLVADFISLFGLFIVNPNEAKVLQLFGNYVGSVRDPGLRFANPFYTGKAISLRVRNFESNKLKVNDLDRAAARSRSPRSSSGAWSIPRKPRSRSMTT